MLKWFRTDSIKSKVYLLTAFGLCLPLLLANSYSLVHRYEEQMSWYQNEVDRITNTFSFGAKPFLKQSHYDDLNTFVKAFARDDRLRKITVKHADGRLAVSLDRSLSSDKSHRDSHEDFLESYLASLLGPVSAKKIIFSDEHMVGEVEMELSLKDFHHSLAHEIVAIALSGFLQFTLCVFLIVQLINRAVIQKVKLLETQAKDLANGSLDHEFIWLEKNEIGSLGRHLESSRKQIVKSFNDLEARVEERTKTIATILQNVHAGFLLVGRDLRVCDGYTKSCYTILRSTTLGQGEPIQSFLGLDDSLGRDLRAKLSNVFSAKTDVVSLLDLLPKRVRSRGYLVSLEYSAVKDGEKDLAQILVSLQDLSSLEVVEAENSDQQMLIKVLEQREFFISFLLNTKQMIAQLMSLSDDKNFVFRVIHTLKGNAAFFGFTQLIEYLHALEDRSSWSVDDFRQIEVFFRTFLADNFDALGVNYDDEFSDENIRYEVTKKQLTELYTDLLGPDYLHPSTRREVLGWISTIQKLPAKRVFAHYNNYVKQLAKRLGKEVDFIIDGENILLDPRRLAPLVHSLPHALRNSLEHGIESPDRRQGKPERGRIILRIDDLNELYWRFVVEDDGRGIDTVKVRQRALQIGLATQEQLDKMTESEVINLVFLGGLSTASKITEVSGRGLGMEALMKCVLELGSRIQLESTEGKGTVIAIEVTKSANIQDLLPDLIWA